MVFSSLVFLCIFLPLVFLLYYVMPSGKGRNILLIGASLLFYAYGEPRYIFLMICSTILNYLFGRLLDDKKSDSFRKGVVVTAIIVNLGLLGIFKYTDMIIGTINEICHCKIAMTNLALPIGISFFTFQAMSYVIDVYRRQVKPEKSYFNIVLYISFFPQLIAGPIIKYHDIQSQILERHADVKEIAIGFRRFCIGLSKKVLIANVVAITADAMFSTKLGQINVMSAWIGAIAYMLQIYYDFSGYSDMAIGLGHMFGFHFLENFTHPYAALNIQDFWRKWHISLSTWFMEYVYIPLGGNRKGKVRTCFNKIIVFLLTGLWHGANWTFVIWGLFHGMFLLLEEVLPIRKLPKFLGHFYTVMIVCVGFVMFRANTVMQGIGMIGKMFLGWSFSSLQKGIALEQLTPVFIVIIIIAIIGSTPVVEKIQALVSKSERVNQIVNSTSFIFSFVLLLLCILSLSSGTYNPFIYFRF